MDSPRQLVPSSSSSIIINVANKYHVYITITQFKFLKLNFRLLCVEPILYGCRRRRRRRYIFNTTRHDTHTYTHTHTHIDYIDPSPRFQRPYHPSVAKNIYVHKKIHTEENKQTIYTTIPKIQIFFLLLSIFRTHQCTHTVFQYYCISKLNALYKY